MFIFRDLTSPWGSVFVFSFVPTISHHRCYPAVAGLAEAKKIKRCIGTAMIQRINMVHLFNWSSPMLQKTHLAHRVVLHISCSKLSPLVAVPLSLFWPAVIFLILSHVLEFVLPAEIPVCQLRTARMLARLHGFSWHKNHSNRKATVDFSAVALLMLFSVA